MKKAYIKDLADKANKEAGKAMKLARKNRKATFFTAVGITAVIASAVSSLLTVCFIRKQDEVKAKAVAAEEKLKQITRPALPPKYEETKKQEEEKKAEKVAVKPKKASTPKKKTPAKKSTAKPKTDKPKTQKSAN